MINNINSTNIGNDNILAAKKIKTKGDSKHSVGVISAPDYLPKYSITQKMNEADQFRKNVLYTNYKTRQKKKNQKKLLAVLAASVAGLFTLKMCKKI